jgi:hypothetical protein
LYFDCICSYCGFWARSSTSIRDYVGPSVGPLVGPSVPTIKFCEEEKEEDVGFAPGNGYPFLVFLQI